MVSQAVKLLIAVAGIYTSFLYWGYLQERLTSVDYTDSHGKTGRWHFPFMLNCCMATAAWLAGALLTLVQPQPARPPLTVFWKPALSMTLASPFGYKALEYINYPMQLLTKSCKLLPVMFMGFVIGGKSYSRAEYISVLLITVGVTMFSFKPSHNIKQDTAGDAVGAHWSQQWKELIGIALVMVNLVLDGFTNAKQDVINKQHKITSFFMMYRVNQMAVVFHVIILLAGMAVSGQDSELLQAWAFLQRFPEARANLAAFCACAAAGQCFIFWIIKEFGSLVNVTITITRKFFSILLSIIQFSHPVTAVQWCGIICVFTGLMYQPAEKAYKSRQKRSLPKQEEQQKKAQ